MAAPPPLPVIPIIGARKLSQLQDNLASFDVTLSADQVKRLDEACQIEMGLEVSPPKRTLSRAEASLPFVLQRYADLHEV